MKHRIKGETMNICYANTIDFFMPLQQRPHHIFNELAKRGHNIFWVDQTRNPNRFRTIINENLTVYHDWDKFCAKFKGQIDVYFSSWSHRWKDIDQLQPKIVVYDSLDLFEANQSEEKNMVAKSDAIFATTQNILEFHREHTDKDIYMCSNGCFPSFRDNIYHKINNDNIKRPYLLFSGALAIAKDGWVDYELIKEMSEDYTLLIVGMPWGNLNKEQLNLLQNHKNVRYLGSRTYDELQMYYSNCDINLLPFKRCQTSDYSSPLKLIEGCNHGKICVSTDIPVAVELSKKYPKAVLVSSSVKEYMGNIKKALELANDPEAIAQCYALADEHSWDKKVDVIEMGINKLYVEKGYIT